MFDKHHTLETKKKMYNTHKKNKQKGMYGENHPNWKGGKHINSGYWSIYSPNHPRVNSKNHVYEHILEAEKMLGRYLTKNERVHHIDGNKLNNKHKNLVILKNISKHAKLHRRIEKLIFELFKKGIIKFNKEKRKYYYDNLY